MNVFSFLVILDVLTLAIS